MTISYIKKVSFELFLDGVQVRDKQQKLPSAEASKWTKCTSPGQYTPYTKRVVKAP